MKKRTLIAATPIVLSSLAYGGEAGAQTLDIQAPNAVGTGITFAGLINYQGEYVVEAQGDHIGGNYFASPYIGIEKDKHCHGPLCATDDANVGDWVNFKIKLKMPPQFRFDRAECMQAQFAGWAEPLAVGALTEPEVRKDSKGNFFLKFKLPRIITEMPPQFEGELFLGNDNDRCLPQKGRYLKISVTQQGAGGATQHSWVYVTDGKPGIGGTLATSHNQYVTKQSGNNELYVDPNTITVTHPVPVQCTGSKLVGSTRIPNETTMNGGFFSATLSAGATLLVKFKNC